LLASLDPDEPHHAICDRVVSAGGNAAYEQSIVPYVQAQSRSGKDLMAALAECESRGVRGSAVYDWLHLAAAKKAGAELFLTLELRDLRSLARPRRSAHRDALKRRRPRGSISSCGHCGSSG
jgi:hypothetical protein